MSYSSSAVDRGAGDRSGPLSPLLRTPGSGSDRPSTGTSHVNRSSDATRPVDDESPRPRPQRAEQPPHGRRWVPAPNRVWIGDQIDVQSSMEELDWLREQGVVMQSA